VDIAVNPLLFEAAAPVVNPAVIQVPTKWHPIRRKSTALLKRETAAKAIEGLQRDGMELFGLTRGQFSLTDLLQAVLAKTGPAELSISTWTAASADVLTMQELLNSGQITGCRWLVDQTFVRRVPALAAQIRRQFGDDAIRVTKTHAKFCTVINAEWQVAIRSSMNLNQNPRLESFQLGHDPELCAFLTAALDDIWRRQDRSLQDGSSSDQSRWWNHEG
jgi:hypothetical protein